MKRREMLRLGFSKAAQVLPLALTAAGSLGKLLEAGAGLGQPQAVASFPASNPQETDKPDDSIKEEE